MVEYSAGMTKKIGLACALIHAPRLLILDEPFEAVDPVSGEGIRSILRNYARGGGTVVMSSHVMELVESLCDELAVVAQGRVLAGGTLDEVRAGSTSAAALPRSGRVSRRRRGVAGVVAILVRLKLTLLRNSLRRSVWRTVGLIIGHGLRARASWSPCWSAWSRCGSPRSSLTADVTVVAFSALTLGWLLMSLLVFGVDETVDPAKFALLPVRAARVAARAAGRRADRRARVATVLVGAGLIITWARTPPLTSWPRWSRSRWGW